MQELIDRVEVYALIVVVFTAVVYAFDRLRDWASGGRV